MPSIAVILAVTAARAAPIPVHTPGKGFALDDRIPHHVFRIFQHNNIPEPIKSIALSASYKYNMATIFVTFADARHTLEQCGALDAFNKLIPGAFKADLLRYCLVWLHGGWYADLSSNFVSDPRPLGKFNDLVVASDPGVPGAFLNGLFAARPRHPGVRAAIDAVISNVDRCFYGQRDLAPTGPILFGKVLKSYPKHVLAAHYHGEIMHIGIPDLVHNKFDGYRAHYAKLGYDKNVQSYGHLYNARRVYRGCK
jgi:mannosyltransferase OCH1-like enzyme